MCKVIRPKIKLLADTRTAVYEEDYNIDISNVCIYIYRAMHRLFCSKISSFHLEHILSSIERTIGLS